jgi:opacity protein-like surface antigen
MTRDRRRSRAATAALILTTACAVALPTAANAAELKLSCAGKGARSKDSAGAVHCAGSPSKGRTIAGKVRNDAGQPVAAKVTVTISNWVLAPNSGYHVKAIATREIVAKADGSFAFRRNPKTRESYRFDVVADAALGIAVPATGEAEIARRLNVKLAKLGGGRLRITVKGTSQRPLKVHVLDPSGYALSGVRPKNVDRRGRATFDLGSMRGQFTYYVDAGRYSDLFWYLGRTKFRL